MKYKAIIFDMDGTIIHTEHIWRNVTRDLIKSKGHEITQELDEKLNHIMAGVGLLRGCELLKELLEFEETIEELAHQKNTVALERMQHELKFIEGFIEFYEQAQKHKLKMAIATNAGHESFAQAQKILSLHRYFGEHMYNAPLVGKYKPDPAIFLHAADKVAVPPAECIAIEDSAYGVQAAVAAGMFCIGINTSGIESQIEKAHKKVNKYNEILLDEILG